MIAAHPEGLDIGDSADATRSKVTVAPNISPLGNGVKVAFRF
jgi:hypothetical protein